MNIKSNFSEFNWVKDRSLRLQNYLKELIASLQVQSQKALIASNTLQKHTLQAKKVANSNNKLNK
ncbi:hypothetical protein [Psychromonas hadalis]|uniref:hypothetical protein n=1 Tax=Psychromonas hadalis TaxID=211669 RepID=UPI0003B33441|nr:hypothetical protein [Psychromonas hadalis]